MPCPRDSERSQRGKERNCFIVIKSKLVLILTKECSGGHGGNKKKRLFFHYREKRSILNGIQ